ncbi:MAG: hypothetical protein EBR46_09765, partial [Betaproteobacteria bacterium]|nr:hypothetical protein [Betaproteobacteria bacterium]
NEREARALVDLLLQRLRAHRPGERSFGVITFSIPQQLLIEGLLQQACEQEPDLEDWFSRDNLDYCFIKNLETVQGDERDEIFFSICFAPRPNGVLSMDFGALNKLGGERRLNVAITRARCAMHVVTSLQPEQIDRSRTNALAVHQLQDYLFFCRNQQRLAERPLRAGDFDGSLQRQIHELLTSEGYQVDCKVGCANYRIDLAVVDPQQPSHYRIGIECDGAAYAAAATVAGPGPGVVAAKASLARPITPLPPAPPPTPPTAAEPNPSAEAAARLATPYRQASLERVSNEFREFHGNQATALIVNRLLALVGVEAPILLREATLRVTQCWNSRAFSQKAHDRLLVVAQDLHRQQRLFLDHEDTPTDPRSTCRRTGLCADAPGPAERLQQT